MASGLGAAVVLDPVKSAAGGILNSIETHSRQGNNDLFKASDIRVPSLNDQRHANNTLLYGTSRDDTFEIGCKSHSYNGSLSS